MTKILFLVAQKNFQHYEYHIPLEIFQKNNIEVTTTSIEKTTAISTENKEIKIDIALKDANIENYNALIIAGGPGALSLANHEETFKIIKQAFQKQKLITAICIAPILLAKANILKNKKATVWNGDNQQSKTLELSGATFTNEEVTVDNNIITANGPNAAEEFANEIIKKLK